MLVVASKIKAMGAAVDLRVSKEFLEALSEKVKDIIIDSARVTKASKRTFACPASVATACKRLMCNSNLRRTVARRSSSDRGCL